ncbi:MAG: hypothetical protein ACYTBZ_23150, partial [Planctomycetota bacterium]
MLRPALSPVPETVNVDPEEDDAMKRFESEAVTDFGLESNRRAMHQALYEVRGAFGQTYPLTVGGKQVVTETILDS